MVAFARASDAVACALQLQQAPLGPDPAADRRTHRRGAGSATRATTSVPTINRTARLRDLAHGGQTVLSGITEELVFDQLPAGAWLDRSGHARSCAMCRVPERVAQLCHPDIRNEFPPLRVAKATAPQRPSGAVHQLRRTRGRRWRRSASFSTEHRLVTLTGAWRCG